MKIKIIAQILNKDAQDGVKTRGISNRQLCFCVKVKEIFFSCFDTLLAKGVLIPSRDEYNFQNVQQMKKLTNCNSFN